MKKIVTLFCLLLAPVIASANAGYYVQGEGGLAVVTFNSSLATLFFHHRVTLVVELLAAIYGVIIILIMDWRPVYFMRQA